MSHGFCSHCLDLNELPGKPAGEETSVGGVPSYVAKGSKKGTVVIATDIFGLGIPNPMILADKFAAETGYTVVVPDIFEKDPIPPKDFQLKKHTNDSDPEGSEKNFDNFGAWLQKGHTPDKSYPIFKKVIDAVKGDGPVAVAGYCYGGKLASLAAQDGEVKGAALHHPAMLEKGEASKVQVPILLSLSETEPIFTPEIQEDWESTLKSKNLLDASSKKYPGTVHGHACRPDLSRPDTKAAFEQSFSNASAFFQKVLA